jgi:phage tail P2-like protein
MNYDVRNTDLTRSLPLPLKNDENEYALAKSIAGQLQINTLLAEKALIYSRIDEAENSLLDALAEDFNVSWYRYDAPIENKRKIVKDCLKLFKRLGTAWAVEQVIKAYFESAAVSEWFEYGGEPGHFRIDSGGYMILSGYAELIRLIEKVKRKSAWLDALSITLYSKINFYMGVAAYPKTETLIKSTASAALTLTAQRQIFQGIAVSVSTGAYAKSIII